MRPSALLVATVATALAAPCVTWAQSASDLARFDAPDAKSTGMGDQSKVVVEAGDADAKATLRTAFSRAREVDRFPNGPMVSVFRRIGVTVTAPFDSKKDEKVDVGSLSGLTTGTSATIEFGHFRWRHPAIEDSRAFAKECEKDIPELIPTYDFKTISDSGAI